MTFTADDVPVLLHDDSIDRTSFMPGVVLACKKIMGLNAGLTCNLDNIMD